MNCDGVASSIIVLRCCYHTSALQGLEHDSYSSED